MKDLQAMVEGRDIVRPGQFSIAEVYGVTNVEPEEYLPGRTKIETTDGRRGKVILNVTDRVGTDDERWGPDSNLEGTGTRSYTYDKNSGVVTIEPPVPLRSVTVYVESELGLKGGGDFIALIAPGEVLNNLGLVVRPLEPTVNGPITTVS